MTTGATDSFQLTKPSHPCSPRTAKAAEAAAADYATAVPNMLALVYCSFGRTLLAGVSALRPVFLFAGTTGYFTDMRATAMFTLPRINTGVAVEAKRARVIPEY
jgi:hypothetical protein